MARKFNGKNFTYAGIGSRETPQDVLDGMEAIAYTLAAGWNLRSGAADGADSAFERGAEHGGAGHATELYLPWPGYNDRKEATLHHPTPEAYLLSSDFHPAWPHLSRGAKSLHARNAHIILGADLDAPARFVLCWTPRAKGGGGTGQGIRIARHYKVPVYDLADEKIRERVLSTTNFMRTLGGS